MYELPRNSCHLRQRQGANLSETVLPQLRGEDGWRKPMLTITIKANIPAADAQGIKERIAMDIERYGDCKVVSIVSDRGREEQLRMK